MTTVRAVKSGSAPVRRQVVIFVVVSYAGAWLGALPLWLDGFRRTSAADSASPLVRLCLAAMMLVPAATAVALTARHTRARDLPAALGLRPARSWSTTAAQCLGGFALPLVLTAGGLALATALGQYQPGGLPTAAVLGGLVASAVVSLPLYFGEEIGWQGYLLPRLMRWGTARAVLVGGVIWGLWHVPVTALGGSYPGHSLLVGLPAMVISAVLIGSVVAWIRLRSDSVLPAVAAHVAVNEFALPLTRLVAARPDQVDPLTAGPLSWPTWLVTALAVAGVVLVARRRGTPAFG
ncbi:CPBP family intramembrane glutamic endopeptidase [Goodfellowiella coeruleoviolacea]|uniref:CAAX protease self-immunity n=1 Tax=Goodfellowiella coeruleoviolacea TaxID=334858 RepID=A0AAE3KK40_9PSEU|nr:CPBP family intramembrane glutamic endopeptidase [Goodfellowiella coeruleoviolacea]MCP2168979.1 CAAX protease self-immunity [Goodfellowiella coeruleoviolacea]